MRKAVFLDRDGVINQTVLKMGRPRAPYSLDEFVFMDGIVEAVKTFKERGFLIIVVTNQPDVARGWVSMEQVQKVNHYIKAHLPIDEIVCCFHTDKDDCQCRKPKPGMILHSAKNWQIDLSQSFMRGDRMSDVEAGQRAGCKTFLLGTSEEEDSLTIPDYRCNHLSEIVDLICVIAQ